MTNKDKQTIALIDMLKLQSICKKLYQLALQYEKDEASLLGGGIDYSKDRIQITPTNQIEEIECRLYDLRNKIDDLITQKHNYIALMQKIKDNEEYNVLIDIYVHQKSLSKIAAERSKPKKKVTKSSIYRLKQRALISYYESTKYSAFTQ